MGAIATEILLERSDHVKENVKITSEEKLYIIILLS
jgi:hypothetical protein